MTGLPAPDPLLRRMARPPVRQATFWVVQASVAVIAGVHLYADLHLTVEGGQFPAGLPVVLLVVPVGYAALRWGLAGAATTGLWASLLWLPHLVLPADQGHLGGDFVDLAVVDAVALLVAWKIDSERDARARGEAATAARLLAEARHRQEAVRYAALVVQAEEDERGRLARELHDEPLQLFLHLARRLEALGSNAGMPRDLGGQLDEARRQALDAAARLRAMARDLRPPALDQLGLAAALASLVDEVESDSDTVTRLRVTGERRRLAADVELGAFRIAQEAVRNAVRHASASHVEVAVAFGERELTLLITDDGCGLPDVALEDAGDRGAGHLGLIGMRERAANLGGRLELASPPGRGTSVRASLPLEDAPSPARAPALRAAGQAAPSPQPEPACLWAAEAGTAAEG